MVYLLTIFYLNRVQFDYYYPRTYSNFIHGKIIFIKITIILCLIGTERFCSPWSIISMS
ncbi:TPA: hypothetical protein HH410_001504 [Escherichia coli]|nr:hypothetical protein [Escherichia coli]EFI8877012.1 hypothetical protein [Escherichia coli]HAH4953887.1 hypothetical protein [Escherichia coli]HAH5017000.1 hypothetical protein [Escherichia coli]HAH5072740.1 hypothetical protein [Escherichia coli]